MSDSEYESDSESQYTYDSEDESVGTEETFASLEAALADMTSRLAELDNSLDTTVAVAQNLEHPVTTIAVSAFTSPRFLENAPFRATKFRLKPCAKALLRIAHHTVTFAELCAAVRNALKGGDVLGASDLLGVLQHLPEIIE